MGMRLVIKGQNDEIILEKDNISSVKYLSDTPNDSNARATELQVSVEVIGKIISQTDDITKKLSLWSLIPAESQDAYRELTLEVISAGIVQRKIVMPNSFLIDYSEDFNSLSGTGSFRLLAKQKKEKISEIKIEGGYDAK
ncbi:membrane-associated protease 1 [Oceanivirga miroungae]|uniref:Membrane-associated protease 1 n=1 Tax=Oceanivirga miroungae TaxID=1130046 RepID=A0A6I8M653_9FUSO|nr:membrane-associated protease 1 [Oceanivirga miroungae]VWL84902.1 hypothetical protein OMES3154_00159 [Oceanivirga miroungae]